jgi:hypothetical protein
MEKSEETKEQETLNKEEIEKQNNQIKIVMIIGGILILSVLIGFFIFNSMKSFQYKGMKFYEEKQGELVFYRTAFPLYSITGNHVADYNIYLRNDPRELKDIAVNGDIYLLDVVGIDSDKEMNEMACGDGRIAIANMRDIFTSKIIGKTFKYYENATCDSEGKYTYIKIMNSTENSIEQFGPSCYYINVKNCEILKTTEKFIVEVLASSQKSS